MTSENGVEEKEVSLSDLTKGQQVYVDNTAIFFVDNNEQPKAACLHENEVAMCTLTQMQQIYEESNHSLFFVDPLDGTVADHFQDVSARNSVLAASLNAGEVTAVKSTFHVKTENKRLITEDLSNHRDLKRIRIKH